MIVARKRDKKNRRALLRKQFGVSTSVGETPRVGGKVGKRRGRQNNRGRRGGLPYGLRKRGGTLPPGLAKRETPPPGITGKIAEAATTPPPGKPVAQKLAKATKPNRGEAIARRMQRMQRKDKGVPFGAQSYDRPVRGPRPRNMMGKTGVQGAPPVQTGRPVVRSDIMKRRRGYGQR